MEQLPRNTVFLLLGAAALAVVLRAATFWHSGFQADDAWITYRYARNLAAGEGFVYNAGEWVYGTTTPLLTLLLAGAEWLGLPLPWAALAINLAATAVILWAAAHIMRRRADAWLLALGLVLIAAGPSQILWSVSGMETALFTAFLLTGVAAYVERDWRWLAVAGAGAFLTRFDGLVFWLAVAVSELALFALARRRRVEVRGLGAAASLKGAGLAVLLAAPWLVFAGFYFHDLVPNSVWAKLALYGEAGFDRTSPAAAVAGLLRAGFLPWFVEVPLAVAALLAAAWPLSRLIVLPVWVFGYLAFLLLGATHIHPWYPAPAHAAIAVAAAIGLARLFAWAIGGRRALSIAAALALAIVALAYGPLGAAREAASRQGDYEHAHADIARYLAQRARPDEVIYAWDIGNIGYLTGNPILDFVGIVSPETVPFNRRRDFLGVLRRFGPEWAVIGLYGDAYQPIVDSAWFRGAYEEAYRNRVPRLEAWAVDDPRRLGTYRPEYVVYRRRSP